MRHIPHISAAILAATLSLFAAACFGWQPNPSTNRYSHSSLKWLTSDKPIPDAHARCVRYVERGLEAKLAAINSGAYRTGLNQNTEETQKRLMQNAINIDWGIASRDDYVSMLRQAVLTAETAKNGLRDALDMRAKAEHQIASTNADLERATSSSNKALLVSSLGLGQAALREANSYIEAMQAEITYSDNMVSYMSCAMNNNLPPTVKY